MQMPATVAEMVTTVIKRVAPQWPLPATVAVNPYHGIMEMSPLSAARHMMTTSGNPIADDPAIYLSRLEHVNDDDCKLASVQTGVPCRNVNDLTQKLADLKINRQAMPTYLDLANQLTGMNWTRMFVDHTSDWVSGWVDTIQVRLTRSKEGSLWNDWVRGVGSDNGLRRRGFGSVSDIARRASQTTPVQWIGTCVDELAPPGLQLEYLETRLRSLIGWASALATSHFNKPTALDNHRVVDLLAIGLTWDFAAKSQLSAWSKPIYDKMITKYHTEISPAQIEALVLAQFALEASDRRKFLQTVGNASQKTIETHPSVHAVFCIDVRSERIRRHLESVSDTIRTSGFAGFFGALVSISDPTLSTPANQAPVLFNPTHTLPLTDHHWIKSKHDRNRWWDAWRGFKENAISCFSYMGPMGVTHLPDMIRSTLKWVPETPPTQHHDRNLALAEAVDNLPIQDRVDIASGFLKGVGMTVFASTVLIVGHGAAMVNNPHVSSYDCGACGGRSGSTNALIICAILNDRVVRARLADSGIHIPDHTHFCPMVHNTTTDDLVELNPKQPLTDQIRSLLNQASELTRTERGLSQPRIRARDWSELRPEWGLVNCHWFIAAPRSMTQKLTLSGQTFLHDYDPKMDPDNTVLEVILTAPVTVATWINMAYNAAVWDPNHFGGGNKWRHNATSGIGVLEGVSGDLRIGFPKQAIHDGNDWVHRPQRLGVVVRAKPDTIREIVDRHSNLRNAVANYWIHLYTIDELGRIDSISGG
ncbi:DUF2309 family protein [bacterium]|nr:DUF2309 family protein [bacterium]